MFKKLISGVLSSILAVSSVLTCSIDHSVKCDESSSEQNVNDSSKQFDLQATNSLGKYIAQSSEENDSEPRIKPLSYCNEENYNVLNASFDAESGIITAVSSQSENCTIVFSFIDEETNDIIQKIEKSVEAGENVLTEAKADYSALPKYFILNAQLIVKNGKQVSNTFMYNMYTMYITNNIYKFIIFAAVNNINIKIYFLKWYLFSIYDIVYT